MNDRNKPALFIVDRREFELACVREFSHSGAQLGSTVSRSERRERIRLAILREDKAHLSWRDTIHTYRQVYEHVYGRPIGYLSSEGGRAPSRATHPPSIGGELYVISDELETDDEPIDEEDPDEEEASREEDDEAV